MDSHANIPLKTLSDKDSLSLLEKQARKSFDKSSQFYKVASEVARECAGLPLALIVVARALREENLEGWEEAARQLKASQPVSPEDEGDVFNCIKLSYDYLKSEHSKTCFLLCSLFPEDYDIPIETLLMYSIGKGLFPDSNIQEARATTHLVIKALKASSLLMDSEKKKGCVRMHDVIRDVAISMNSKSEDGQGYLAKAGCELHSWPVISADDKGYNAISVMKNRICKLPTQLVCPKLHLLLLQHNGNLEGIPILFFENMNELRVLDLSFTSIYTLSESLHLLTNLRAVYMDCCNISDYSRLGDLKKLEILSVKEYPHSKLPIELGNLTNLRMLDVRNTNTEKSSFCLQIPSGVISKLHRLEELYLPFVCWSCEFEEAGEESNLGFDEITSLRYLNILKVGVRCIPKNVPFYPTKWVNFDIGINNSYSIDFQTRQRSLNLFHSTIDSLPDWFAEVVTVNTEVLQYMGCKGLHNLLVEYHRGKLHVLKHLTVANAYSAKLKVLMDATVETCIGKGPVFEKLEELHLNHVKFLEELLVGELPCGSLSMLKVLKVNWCNKLGKVLIPSKLLKRLPNLEIIYCKYVGIEFVFGCEEFQPEQSKLKDMELVNLNALRSICNGPAPPAMFQSLERLSIDSCNIVGSLFTSEASCCLFHLEELVLKDCHFIQKIVETSNEKIVLPKLRRLHLEELPILCYDSANCDIESPSLVYLYVSRCPQFLVYVSDLTANPVRSLCNGPAPPAMFLSLKRLSIGGCDIVGNLFSIDTARCLIHLEELVLKFCHFIRKIVEASNEKIVLPKLRRLHLEHLPILCYDTANCDLESPSLVYLYVRYCPQVSVSVSDLTANPVRSLCNGPAPPAMFQSLEHLFIKGCDIVGSLFTFETARCLIHLLELVLKRCPFIRKIVEASNEKIVLPKLRRLSLEKLVNLRYDSADCDLKCPSLEKLEVKRCPQFLISACDLTASSDLYSGHNPKKVDRVPQTRIDLHLF